MKTNPCEVMVRVWGIWAPRGPICSDKWNPSKYSLNKNISTSIHFWLIMTTRVNLYEEEGYVCRGCVLWISGLQPIYMTPAKKHEWPSRGNYNLNCLIRLQVISEYQVERPPVLTTDFPHIRVISLWVSWNALGKVLGYENSTNYPPRVWYEPSDSHIMNGESRLLV